MPRLAISASQQPWAVFGHIRKRPNPFSSTSFHPLPQVTRRPPFVNSSPPLTLHRRLCHCALFLLLQLVTSQSFIHSFATCLFSLCFIYSCHFIPWTPFCRIYAQNPPAQSALSGHTTHSSVETRLQQPRQGGPRHATRTPFFPLPTRHSATPATRDCYSVLPHQVSRNDRRRLPIDLVRTRGITKPASAFLPPYPLCCSSSEPAAAQYTSPPPSNSLHLFFPASAPSSPAGLHPNPLLATVKP